MFHNISRTNKNRKKQNKMTLKIDDKVMLKGYPKSKNYDRYNPDDLIGVVISVTGYLNPVIVLWENGIRNSCIEKYLELV